jgi:hypothetical protein
MAGNPSITVRIAANVREFLKGTDQVEDALEDLAVESGDTARDVESDTERIERAFRDAARSVKVSSEKAGRDVREGFGDSAVDSARDAGRETGSEFAANLSESLASGDLSAIGKDTAAGLVAGFAGMGGLIGVALAGAAIPIAAFFGRVQKQAEDAKANIDAIFTALKESGGALTEAFRAQEFDRIWNADPSKWQSVSNAMQDAGISAGTIRDAVVGSAPAVEKVARLQEGLRAKIDAQRVLLNTTTGQENARAARALDTYEAQSKAAQAILDQSGYLKTGKTLYEDYAEIAVRGADAERERAKQLRDQLETLKALNREATKGSAASARILEESDKAARELRGIPGGGRRDG